MTRFDIVCLGEPFMESNQQPDGRFEPGFDGDVSNVAMAAARQGTKVGIVSRIGSDAEGDRLMDLWNEEGIDASGVANRTLFRNTWIERP